MTILKCGNFFVDGSVYVRDGHRDKIIKQVEESLVNLHTDYIDLLLVHWPDENTPFEETMNTLQDLKNEGKVLHVGVSNFSKEQMEECQQYIKLEAYQPAYLLLDRKNEKVLEWAASEGMGIMTYGSLSGGLLTGKFRKLQKFEATDSRNRFYKQFHEPLFSKAQEVLKIMDGISADHDNVPLSHIALCWSYSKPFVSTCIVGAQTSDKVIENAAAFDFQLTEEEIRMLDEATKDL